MSSCRTCVEGGISCLKTSRRADKGCDFCEQNGATCSLASHDMSSTQSGQPTGNRRTTRLSTFQPGRPLAYQPDGASRLLDDARKIVRVLIAIDFGTQATKAVFMTIRKCETEPPRLLQQKDVIRRVETITWDSGDSECPTQIAIGSNPDGISTTFTTYWGCEIGNALENQLISEKDILRGMKATVFATNNNKANHHLEYLMRRIEDLRSTHASHNPSFPVLTPRKVWTTFQTKAFSFVLAKIRGAVGSDLPWPLPDRDRYPDADYISTFKFSDFPECVVKVALPVPAGLSVEHSQLALATAREAGLPNCYLVAEPASVAALNAQDDYQTREDAADFRPTLIVDHGCGTVDLTLTSISTPKFAQNSYHGTLCMRELIPGIMQWCGGDFANLAFREMVKGSIDIDLVVQSINSNEATAVPFTPETFLDYLDRQFEDKKKQFDGTNMIRLPLPYGAPLALKSGISIVAGLLVIPSEMAKEIFSHTLKGVVQLVDGQLEDYVKTIPSYQRSQFPVKRIVLAGGGNENKYVSWFLSNRYEHGRHDEKEPYPKPLFLVEVLKPATRDKALIMTVQGALLLLLDKEFVGSRIARRGYCFASDEFLIKGRPYVEDQIAFNKMVRDYMAQDAAKFVLKTGKVLKGRFEQNVRGTRGLWLDEAHNNGWEVEEILWYTDNAEECRDGLWVRSPHGTFYEAGKLTFNLTRNDAAQFKIDVTAEGKMFKCLEYEVTLVVENMVMEFEVSIPRSGTFDDNDGMQDLIKKKATLECGHIFETYTTSNVKREY